MATLGSIQNNVEIGSGLLVGITKTGIDAKAAASTLIGTTENGSRRFYPVMVIFEITAATALTVVPTVSVGTNSATYNNLLAAAALAGLTGVNNILQSLVTGVVSSVAPNTGIFVKVTVGAVATSATMSVHVLGYYN